MAQPRLLPAFLCFLLLTCFAEPLCAETPAEEEAAIKALPGIPSNLQKNRDGTVRFVRFSKSIVTDEHLAHVAAFQHLDYLAVVTPSVSSQGLQVVEKLTNLDTLMLSNSQLDDATMPALAKLPKLERLYLDGTKITDEGLVHLSGLQSLRTLSLANTAVSDAGMSALSGLENLEELRLSGTSVSDTALEHFAALTKLKTLRLEGTQVTGSGLVHLAGLQNLEVLDLTASPVVSEHLAALPKLKKLKRVLLYETQVNRGELPELPKTDVYLGGGAGEQTALARFLAKSETPAKNSGPEDTLTAAEGPLLEPASVRFGKTDEVPNLQRHVIPLLGRLGCNGRSCHGSFQGQGGFRLSMFGYDFEEDLKALAGGESPRVDLENPEESLILLKPTHEDEHGGGERFQLGSWQHQVLLQWIRSGAPGIQEPSKLVQLEVTPAELQFSQAGQEQQLAVIAHWADGSLEDVTCLTRFQTNDDTVATVTADGLVTAMGKGDTHVVAFYDNGVQDVPIVQPVTDLVGERHPEVPQPTPIDELVVQKLSKLGIVPSELSSDEAFLRRVSLDIAGTLPTPAEIEAFCSEPPADKRAQKIDELLERPAYAEWWTNIFCDLTGSNSQFLGTTDMNRPAAEQWRAWIHRRVQDNVGWDRMAAGILLAQSRRPGQTYDDYAQEQSSYMARTEPEDFTALDNPLHYYWFRSNLQVPSDRALSFGYIFMGVRLECAQCHKHPFDQWSKQDFEQFTQFFTRIKAGVAPDAAAAQLQLKEKLGVPKKLDTAALRRQMYLRVSAEGKSIPWNEIYIEPPGGKPQQAKLLGSGQIDLNEYEDPREPLVEWLTSADNPYFARAMVNRIWAHYFGVGIVEPVDDLNLANPPSNGPLLDYLSEQFVAHGYDLKWLHRTITNSRTYQLSWQPNETNQADSRNFSRAQLRRLPAEVVIDAILQATGSDAALKSGGNLASRKIAQHPLSIQARGIDYSLLVFGKPLRTTNCDCERQMQPTLLQSLYVRNDHELLGWLERKDGWLAELSGKLGEPLESELMPVAAEGSSKESEPPTPEQVDELIVQAYLRSFSRPPGEAELQVGREHIAAAETTTEGLRDLMWALLNSKEFLTNH